jgi:hypothetical protein
MAQLLDFLHLAGKLKVRDSTLADKFLQIDLSDFRFSQTTKRTGWVNRGVALPESIADHMYR